MEWLTRFGSIYLPQYDVNFNAGTAPAQLAVTQLYGGGIFDTHGLGRSPQRYPKLITYPCTVVGSSTLEARTAIRQLRAAIGTRQKLWRSSVVDEEAQWCRARLVDVDATMKSKMPRWHVPVTLTFAQLAGWNGVHHSGGVVFGQDGAFFGDGLFFGEDDIYALDGTEEVDQNITLSNGGNLPVTGVKIYVVAGSAAITALTIKVTGVSYLRYTGTVAVGKTLYLDCDIKKITNDGANAYANLALTAEHYIADWLVLQPGDNTVVVNRTGGGTGSTVEFQFYDGWA